MLRKIFLYPGPLWKFYSASMLILVGISVAVWGPLLIVAVVLGASRSRQSWFVRCWCVFIARIYFLHFEITGRENHDGTKPSLIVTNHQSLMDIPAAYLALDGDIRMVAKKELFNIPIFGWSISHIEFIPIDRGNRTSGRDASEKIADRIRSGLHVWVAPEGTRSEGKNLLPFKKGAFAVAIDAHVPVQPILIENSFEACPKNSFLVRTGTTIRVHVLPRISSDGFTIPERAQLAEVVRTKMVEEFERIELASKLAVQGSQAKP